MVKKVSAKVLPLLFLSIISSLQDEAQEQKEDPVINASSMSIPSIAVAVFFQLLPRRRPSPSLQVFTNIPCSTIFLPIGC